MGSESSSTFKSLENPMDGRFPRPGSLTKRMRPLGMAGRRWHRHQLWRSAATGLRKQYGLEAAKVILGHQTLQVTETCAEKNVHAAQRIMSEIRRTAAVAVTVQDG